MKRIKLSLKRIVENSLSQDEIDSFSDEIEGSPTPRAREAMPNFPEGVPADRDPSKPLHFNDFLSDFGISAMEFSSWRKRAEAQGMTPDLFKEISSRVGDFENFIEELNAVNSSLSVPFYKNLGNASGGPSPVPTKYASTKEPQIPWSELANRGDNLKKQSESNTPTRFPRKQRLS